MCSQWDRGPRIGGGEGGREEVEEDAKAKEEPGFLKFLPPEPTSRAELGNKQNLGTHRTLAVDSWDMRFWEMAHQALGLLGLGAPDLTMGLLTYKLLLTYHKERNPCPWSQNTSLHQ